MRLSPLCLAVSLTLLGACNQQPTRAELGAESLDSAAASAAAEFDLADAASAKVEGQSRAAANQAPSEAGRQANFQPATATVAVAAGSPPPPPAPSKLFFREQTA